MDNYEGESHINVGTGLDLSILELAEMVRDLVHPGATIQLDRTKPDGTPRKLLDVSALSALGWSASIPLRNGLESTYRWYLDHAEEARGLPMQRTSAAAVNVGGVASTI